MFWNRSNDNFNNLVTFIIKLALAAQCKLAIAQEKPGTAQDKLIEEIIASNGLDEEECEKAKTLTQWEREGFAASQSVLQLLLYLDPTIREAVRKINPEYMDHVEKTIKAMREMDKE